MNTQQTGNTHAAEVYNNQFLANGTYLGYVRYIPTYIQNGNHGRVTCTVANSNSCLRFGANMTR